MNKQHFYISIIQGSASWFPIGANPKDKSSLKMSRLPSEYKYVTYSLSLTQKKIVGTTIFVSMWTFSQFVVRAPNKTMTHNYEYTKLLHENYRRGKFRYLNISKLLSVMPCTYNREIEYL